MIPSQRRVSVGSVGLGTQNMCTLSTVLISGLCPLVVMLFSPLMNYLPLDWHESHNGQCFVDWFTCK